MTYKYIEIRREGEIYKIWNLIYEQYVGEIRRERMGQWMHWQLFQYPGCGFTNGCIKEISKFITTLYSRKKKTDEEIKQEKTNSELNTFGNKIIDLLKPLNKAEKFKVIDSLYKSLLEILKEDGIIIQEEK